MTMREGTVSARLQSPRVTSWPLLSPNCLPIVEANGAKLNHTTKERKKANHVRWRTRCGAPGRNMVRTRVIARRPPELGAPPTFWEVEPGEAEVEPGGVVMAMTLGDGVFPRVPRRLRLRHGGRT